MKRNLTAEQITKRDERRTRFKTLWKQVADMPELERIEMSNKLGLVTCDGHALSLGNAMLIALQCPRATILGGFRQWLKHGRSVRKGEHGAMIWVPLGHKTTEPTTGETTTESEDTRFIIGTMFDIGQTEATEQDATAPFVPETESPKAAPTPKPESREMVLTSMTQNFFSNMQLSTGSAI